MILYYAMGGGLGHLTRARAVLHTLRLESESVILTASRFAGDERVTGGLNVIHVPAYLAHDRAAYRAWLADLFASLRPAALYLDTFPAGIRGEFCDFPPLEGVPIHYLARLLKWKEYAKLLEGRLPRLEETHILEPLATEHEEFIRRHCAKQSPLRLEDPPHLLHESALSEAGRLALSTEPFWLVVHSGPVEEIMELLAYAAEMRRIERVEAQLILVAPAPPPELPKDVFYIDIYPAAALFPMAARVISACGFNVMRQMARHYGKHRYMPCARRFDDQFKRAARLSDCGGR